MSAQDVRDDRTTTRVAYQDYCPRAVDLPELPRRVCNGVHNLWRVVVSERPAHVT